MVVFGFGFGFSFDFVWFGLVLSFFVVLAVVVFLFPIDGTVEVFQCSFFL